MLISLALGSIFGAFETVTLGPSNSMEPHHAVSGGDRPVRLLARPEGAQAPAGGGCGRGDAGAGSSLHLQRSAPRMKTLH